MKLTTLSEFRLSKKPTLELHKPDITTAFHDFLDTINDYFITDNRGWGKISRVRVGFEGKTITIPIRHGVSIGSHQGDKLDDEPRTITGPKVSIEASFDNSIEMRLEVPRGYREQIDWEQEHMDVVRVVATQVGGQLRDVLTEVANNILVGMMKAGKITDWP